MLIEPGPAGILNAKKRGLKYLINSDFENANFFPDSIPAAGLFDVLEHIEKDLEFLKNLHFCIAKNGLLYLTVPANQLHLVVEAADALAHLIKRRLQQITVVLESLRGIIKEFECRTMADILPP